MEILPGIHQIQGVIGPRLFYQYLLTGEINVLIDTGIAATPKEAIFPYLERLGLKPTDISLAIITHADVDHFGGNFAIKSASPKTLLAAHQADVAWIESADKILEERYGWYDSHGFGYPPEVKKWLREVLGPDTRIDLCLEGGEIIKLSDSRQVEILHLPGHSAGHLGIYDPSNRAAIIIDAILWKGLLDLDGNLISPPPYFEIESYLWALEILQGLDIAHLFTAHYPDKHGDEVAQFLEESQEFVAQIEDAVVDVLQNSEGSLTLHEVTLAVNERLGPYTVMEIELAGPVRAHLLDLERQNVIRREEKYGRMSWIWGG